VGGLEGNTLEYPGKKIPDFSPKLAFFLGKKSPDFPSAVKTSPLHPECGDG